jgi:uncharacterized coiled-coil protein SlyX
MKDREPIESYMDSYKNPPERVCPEKKVRELETYTTELETHSEILENKIDALKIDLENSNRLVDELQGKLTITIKALEDIESNQKTEANSDEIKIQRHDEWDRFDNGCGCCAEYDVEKLENRIKYQQSIIDELKRDRKLALAYGVKQKVLIDEAVEIIKTNESMLHGSGRDIHFKRKKDFLAKIAQENSPS